MSAAAASEEFGGRGLAVGGGGIGTLLVIVVLLLSGGLNGGNGGNGGSLGGLVGQTLGDPAGPQSDLSQTCTTGADANQREDCRVVGFVDSVQAYWTGRVRGGRGTRYVTGRDEDCYQGRHVATGCGTASAAVGPVLLVPRTVIVYLDVGFFDDLRTRFGGPGRAARRGLRDRARVRPPRAGPAQGTLATRCSERLGAWAASRCGPSLRADCYAGMWAGRTRSTPATSSRSPRPRSRRLSMRPRR